MRSGTPRTLRLLPGSLAGLVALLSLVSIPYICHAQEEPIVTVEGVRFYCDGCVVIDDTFCGIPQSGNSLVVPCEKVFDYLLGANRKMKVSFPKNGELVEYLMRERVAAHRVKTILETIEQRRAYHYLKSQTLAVLLRRYPAVFQEALHAGWGSQEMLQMIWRLLRGVNELQLLGVKGIVMGRLKEVSYSDIVQELPGRDDRDATQALLSIAASTAESYGTEQQRSLYSFMRVIDSCESGDVSNAHICDLSQFTESETALREFLVPYYLRFIRGVLKDPSVSLKRKSQVLGAIPSEILSLSDVGEIASLALTQFIAARAELRKEHLDTSRLIELLALGGLEQQHLVAQVQQLLALVELRQQNDTAPITSGDDPQAGTVVQSVTLKKPWRMSSRIVFSIAFALGMIGITLTAYRRWRANTLLVEDCASKSESQLNELQQSHEREVVLQYFGLEVSAKPDDVRKAYRKLARLHHPDVANADADKFIEIQEYYERAQKLLGNA